MLPDLKVPWTLLSQLPRELPERRQRLISISVMVRGCDTTSIGADRVRSGRVSVSPLLHAISLSDRRVHRRRHLRWFACGHRHTPSDQQDGSAQEEASLPWHPIHTRLRVDLKTGLHRFPTKAVQWTTIPPRQRPHRRGCLCLTRDRQNVPRSVACDANPFARTSKQPRTASATVSPPHSAWDSRAMRDPSRNLMRTDRAIPQQCPTNLP